MCKKTVSLLSGIWRDTYITLNPETERWYGKDMECPKAWEEWLYTGGVVPTMLLGNGHHDLFRYRPESVSPLP